MDLKEQTRALLLLRRWLEMADNIGGASGRGWAPSTIRAVAELAADTSSFLVLEAIGEGTATLTVQTVGFHCGVGARRSGAAWECVKCGARFEVTS